MPKIKKNHSIIDSRIVSEWMHDDEDFENVLWEDYYIVGDENYEGIADANDYEYIQVMCIGIEKEFMEMTDV